jgi:hypothetical protein
MAWTLGGDILSSGGEGNGKPNGFQENRRFSRKPNSFLFSRFF